MPLSYAIAIFSLIFAAQLLFAAIDAGWRMMILMRLRHYAIDIADAAIFIAADTLITLTILPLARRQPPLIFSFAIDFGFLLIRCR